MTKQLRIFNCFFHICPENGSLQVHLETSRLRIRSIDKNDLPFSTALYGDPELTRLFDSGKPLSPIEVLELIKGKGRDDFLKGNPWGIFSIFDKETNHFIGHIDLFPSELLTRSLEIGYIISQNAKGKGFGIEAARCFVFDFVPLLLQKGYINQEFPIDNIIATVHPENYSSRRLLDKLGMKFQKSLERFGQPRYLYSIAIFNY
jgi:[ribosomal protein S5]-alanine N-acetyltransferase